MRVHVEGNITYSNKNTINYYNIRYIIIMYNLHNIIYALKTNGLPKTTSRFFRFPDPRRQRFEIVFEFFKPYNFRIIISLSLRFKNVHCAANHDAGRKMIKSVPGSPAADYLTRRQTTISTTSYTSARPAV